MTNLNPNLKTRQGGPGHRYGPEVDLWSAGVVLFILLGGYPPFYNESEPALFNQIRSGKYSFNDPVWDNISDGCAPSKNMGVGACCKYVSSCLV